MSSGGPCLFRLVVEVAPLVLWACVLRHRPRPRPRLPPVSAKSGLSPEEALILAGRVNRIVRPLTARSGHACWYRCYPLAALLRRRGLDARLNIGLICLAPNPGPARGHAWLTLDGELFNEPDSVRGNAAEDASSAARSFPHLLADDGQGLRYWVAAGPDGGFRGRRAERGV